jgi:uncharacterized protein
VSSDAQPERLAAADVLRRYKDDQLPAFCGIDLTDVNQVGLFGERPLGVAAVGGNLAEIQALVEGGAEINAPGELGNTALHEAVSQGHVAAVKLLLGYGADTGLRNEFGDTPLDLAKAKGREDLITLLREASGSGGKGR